MIIKAENGLEFRIEREDNFYITINGEEVDSDLEEIIKYRIIELEEMKKDILDWIVNPSGCRCRFKRDGFGIDKMIEYHINLHKLDKNKNEFILKSLNTNEYLSIEKNKNQFIGILKELIGGN